MPLHRPSTTIGVRTRRPASLGEVALQNSADEPSACGLIQSRITIRRVSTSRRDEVFGVYERHGIAGEGLMWMIRSLYYRCTVELN